MNFPHTFQIVGVFMTKGLPVRLSFRVRPAALAAFLLFFGAFAAAPALADPCEDIARHLADQIDGLKVNFGAANIIYLTHPAAKELSIGCRGRDYSAEFYAKTDRKIKPAFYDLVGAATAIVFTLPKDDSITGSTRCLKRMGLLRGDRIAMRYKRLSMECTRTRTDASIVIRRGNDQ